LQRSGRASARWDRTKIVEEEIVTPIKVLFLSGMQLNAEKAIVRGSEERNAIKWTMKIQYNLGHNMRVKYRNTKILKGLFQD
jgi:hypothetical protein